MIGVVSFGARVAVNQPANGVSVSLVFTNDKRIAKVTDSTQVPFRQVKATFGKAAHGDDERHVVALGKTTLIWDGHAASDSVTLSAPVERVWVVRGPRGKPVLLRWRLNRRIQPFHGRSAGGAGQGQAGQAHAKVTDPLPGPDLRGRDG